MTGVMEGCGGDKVRGERKEIKKNQDSHASKLIFILKTKVSLFIIDYFLEPFEVTTKLSRRYGDFTYPSCPTWTQPPPLSSSCAAATHLLQLMNPHHHHPKAIVYVRAHLWRRTFYGFWQMYNNVYLPL